MPAALCKHARRCTTVSYCERTIPMKKSYFIFVLSLLIFFGTGVSESTGQDRYSVKVVEEDKLVYRTYEFAGTGEVDISDFIISADVIGKNPFNVVYSYLPDFKLLLLKNGYAKLKNPTSAPKYYRNAENTAKEKKIGPIWRTKPEPKDAKPEIPASFWKKTVTSFWGKISFIGKFIWGNIKEIILLLGSLGVISAIARHLYKKFYIQRRCKLLIIGEPYSGKTALLMSLVNPKVEKEEILKLDAHSPAVTEKERQDFIPRGKFEIYPSVSDVPGHFYATVWDKFFKGYGHAMIILISAFKGDGRNSNGSIRRLDPYKDIDQKYIDIQLGCVQVYIQGGLGSEFTKKPKLLIMYISKFDLFSEYPPDDSSSQKTKEVLEKVFGEHIEVAAKAAKDVGIPFKVIFGSAVEKWNTGEILDIVVNQLYGM